VGFGTVGPPFHRLVEADIQLGIEQAFLFLVGRQFGLLDLPQHFVPGDRPREHPIDVGEGLAVVLLVFQQTFTGFFAPQRLHLREVPPDSIFPVNVVERMVDLELVGGVVVLTGIKPRNAAPPVRFGQCVIEFDHLLEIGHRLDKLPPEEQPVPPPCPNHPSRRPRSGT